MYYKKMHYNGVLLILLVFFLPLNTYAQESNDDKIKIGLVLSGGGAKGLAHIGALKVIEESGVQIDYIGGTSMGAIIGSLYASGYSANQLDSIFRTTDFRKLIGDELPRNTKSHYEKEGTGRYIVSFPFNDFKIRFPSGLSKGQNLYNLFSQLMYPVKGIEDFSELPIPFFCVGTDIETGERLILDTGSLPQAVAASGSLPSVFTPVYINDKLVSDGGIVDNYPVEELKSRGMDYIIGVDVQDDLMERDKLLSAFEILDQISNFSRSEAMIEKRKITDLYIRPDIRDFSVLSFDKGYDIVKAGETAAQQLKHRLDSLSQLQKEPIRNNGLKSPDSLHIRNIKIFGNEHLKRNLIRGKLKIDENEKISYKTLNEGINNLSATKDFERIQYELISTGDGEDDLYLHLTEGVNRTVLQLGLHYDGLYDGAGIVNFTHKDLLFKNDRISTDLILGENFRYRLDYFIDKGVYWSFGINSSLNQFNKTASLNIITIDPINEQVNSKTSIDYLDWTNQVFVETFFLNQNALRFRIGLEHKYTKLKTGSFAYFDDESSLKIQSLEDTGHAFGPYGFLEYDSLDHPYFPTEGTYVKASMQNFLFKSGFTTDFNRLSVVNTQLSYVFSLSSKFSVQTDAFIGHQFGSGEWKAMDYFLGGYGNNFVNNIVPFFGYSFLSEGGNSVLNSSIKIDYHPFLKHHFILGYNAANIGDNLYKKGKAFNLPDYSAFFTGFGWESLLGPLEIYYSFSPEVTKSRWFISLGLWF